MHQVNVLLLDKAAQNRSVQLETLKKEKGYQERLMVANFDQFDGQIDEPAV